jgi:hypothetical protein
VFYCAYENKRIHTTSELCDFSILIKKSQSRSYSRFTSLPPKLAFLERWHTEVTEKLGDKLVARNMHSFVTVNGHTLLLLLLLLLFTAVDLSLGGSSPYSSNK